MSRAMRLIGALLLALCAVTAQAVTATAEAVSPTQLWCDAYMMSCLYPSDQAAAQATATWYNSTYAPYFQASISCDGSGNCTQTLTCLQATNPPVIYPLHLIGTIGCPTPTVNPGVPYSYNPATWMCERPTQIACPVPDLPKPPPPFSDACSQALEDHVKNIRDPSVCPNFDVAKNDQVAKCVASKLAPASMPITATYRTDPYQKHLWEVWSRAVYLRVISYSFLGEEIKQACAVSKVNADVQAELQHHGNLITPTKTAGSHGESRAIDIPKNVVKALQEKAATFSVTTSTTVNGKRVTKTVSMGIEDYINSTTDNPTPDCNANANANPPRHIQWGGNFKNSPPDIVHFQFP